MAVGAGFVKCNTNGMSLEQILKSIIWQDATTGAKGVRMIIVDVAAAGDIVPGVDCNTSQIHLDTHIRDMIFEDGAGMPALLVYNTGGL